MHLSRAACGISPTSCRRAERYRSTISAWPPSDSVPSCPSCLLKLGQPEDAKYSFRSATLLGLPSAPGGGRNAYNPKCKLNLTYFGTLFTLFFLHVWKIPVIPLHSFKMTAFSHLLLVSLLSLALASPVLQPEHDEDRWKHNSHDRHDGDRDVCMLQLNKL